MKTLLCLLCLFCLCIFAVSCGKLELSVQGNPAKEDSVEFKLQYTLDFSQLREKIQELGLALAEVNGLEKRVLLQTPSLLETHSKWIAGLDHEPEPTRLLQGLMAKVVPGRGLQLKSLSTNRAFNGLEQTLSEVRALEDTQSFQKMQGELVALHAWINKVERLVESVGELAHKVGLQDLEEAPLATLVTVDISPEELHEIEQRGVTGRVVKLQVSNLRLTPTAEQLLAGN